MATVYLNGEFMALEAARIPVLDRGFLFGDGAYELIPVYSRRPFRQSEHLRRLQHSLDGIRLQNPLTEADWASVVSRVIAENAAEDQSIYIQVTRGADVRRDHAFPPGVTPTVFVMSSPLVPPSEAERQRGVAAITVTDSRWAHCQYKTIALLANVLMRQDAVEAGCAEAILIRDGYLTEGAASSIFLVKEGVLKVPPLSHRMLPGITYDVVLELARAHSIPLEVRDIAACELRSADELWMTSSTREVLPITTLDGQPVGSGQPGALAERMHELYQAFKDDVMRRGVT